MATKLNALTRLTPSSTTATQVSSVLIRTPAVTFATDSANTVQMYIGASDVTNTKGIAIAPGQSLTIQSPAFNGTDNEVLLNEIYIYSTAASQICYVAYLGRN